ncbi:exosortase-associated protein EpsI, B-type [Pseudoduganella umbonata]|uniref:EpsI family protein n=1 Tax=Pseudoduganella umbonata TaxID=864828 RepID=A0A4V1EEA2_9BURK|nr:exosortase-associated protein EpsI, B-type [Pseudoduganella umbonata]MBB3223202.1 EpsI family protein [Pseudoduganella umbonata]QCP13871.1 EpsI family protein [Pseudoduganella umbonata]
MKKSLMISVVMGAMMVSSAAVTKALTPTVKLADRAARFELSQTVPVQFGDWRVDESIIPLQVDPDTQASLDKIYNQTLSRTYINGNGERIMLSIAYGGDQSDTLGVHRPETCYTAQGFNVKDQVDGMLPTTYGDIAVRRLYASAGSRFEPITYWITVGDQVTRPGMSQKLQQLKYGLSGSIPDGMLVRVSNISTDAPASYALQQKFVADMLSSLDATGRKRLIGG